MCPSARLAARLPFSAFRDSTASANTAGMFSRRVLSAAPGSAIPSQAVVPRPTEHDPGNGLGVVGPAGAARAARSPGPPYSLHRGGFMVNSTSLNKKSNNARLQAFLDARKSSSTPPTTTCSSTGLPACRCGRLRQRSGQAPGYCSSCSAPRRSSSGRCSPGRGNRRWPCSSRLDKERAQVSLRRSVPRGHGSRRRTTTSC